MKVLRIHTSNGPSGTQITATVTDGHQEFMVDLTGTELAGAYDNAALIPCVEAACEYGEFELVPVEEPQPEETFVQTMARVMAATA